MQRNALIFVHDSVGIYDPVKNVYRTNRSPYRRKGVADILGIWNSKPLAIESKIRPRKPTKEQEQFLKEWNEAGGIGFVAYSLSDVIEMLGSQVHTHE